MNNARRKAISSVIDKLRDLQEAVDAIRDEETEYRDNIPENLQTSEKYEIAEQTIENLGSAYDYIDEIVDFLEDAKA